MYNKPRRLKKIKQAGLHCEVGLITDFPGETEADFKETIRFLAVNQEWIPKIAQVNPVQFLPGTAISGKKAQDRPSDRLSRILEFLTKNKFIYNPHFLKNLHYKN